MASPPYAFSPSALSPEPAFEQQVVGISTKKRGATGSAAAPSLKRRKTSNMSVVSGASAHPLRQTSFPPDDLPTPFTARSPSIDMDTASLVSGSYVSGGVGTSAAPVKGKAKRGRKPKADKMGACDKTPSQAGGRALTAVSGASGGTKNNAAGGGGDAGAGDDDDAEAEADDAETAALATTRTDEDRKKERRLRAALVSCMDQDQYDRIAAWRAVKLPDAVIKRLVNATVSQSVPAGVVTAVRSVTKYFLTEIIANARRVQDEWIGASDEKQADSEWPGMVLSRDGPEVHEMYDQQAKLAQPEWQSEKAPLILKKPPKGPLRPDHIREAWRRYKSTVQSQGAGTLALWHHQQRSGVERFPARTGGKRIFK